MDMRERRVIALGHDAEQLAVGASVIGDGHGGIPCCSFRDHYLLGVMSGEEVCVGGDEAGALVLHAGHMAASSSMDWLP